MSVRFLNVGEEALTLITSLLLCRLQVLVFIFSMIRRKLWDYGRLALVADHEGSVNDGHAVHSNVT